MTDERAAEGVEHLQAAARELVAAARSFLEVVEDVVEDRGRLAEVAAAVSDLVRDGVGRRGAPWAAAWGPDGPSGTDAGGHTGSQDTEAAQASPSVPVDEPPSGTDDEDGDVEGGAEASADADESTPTAVGADAASPDAPTRPAGRTSRVRRIPLD